MRQVFADGNIYLVFTILFVDGKTIFKFLGYRIADFSRYYVLPCLGQSEISPRILRIFVDDMALKDCWLWL